MQDLSQAMDAARTFASKWGDPLRVYRSAGRGYYARCKPEQPGDELIGAYYAVDLYTVRWVDAVPA